jgi:hypothetical protein
VFVPEISFREGAWATEIHVARRILLAGKGFAGKGLKQLTDAMGLRVCCAPTARTRPTATATSTAGFPLSPDRAGEVRRSPGCLQRAGPFETPPVGAITVTSTAPSRKPIPLEPHLAGDDGSGNFATPYLVEFDDQARAIS